MSNVSKKFVAILAIGILVGTTATIVSASLKPFNLALAQLRVPFMPQQSGVQAPLQQQPITAASSGGGGGGPNCSGCITTQNLANGAVTTAKIAPGAVSIFTTTVEGDPTDVNPGASVSSTVTCPSGYTVTGGGFLLGLNPNGGLLQVVRSVPVVTGVGWTAEVRNTSTEQGSGFEAFAECATIHP
jgi:hypothetical protein